MLLKAEVQSTQKTEWSKSLKGAGEPPPQHTHTHAFPHPHHCNYFSSKLSEDGRSIFCWIQGHEAKLKQVVGCHSDEKRDSMKIDVLDSKVSLSPFSFWLQELHVPGWNIPP